MSASTTPQQTPASPDSDLVKEIEQTSALLSKAQEEIGTVIYGQNRVVDLALIALLSGGHALLVGVPGLAKTLLVETISQVLGLDTKRIQCTPDLMPADILGSEILDEDSAGKRNFRFVKGPIFTQFLMADEINRASPRTQSALLQAMQEYEVTIAGKPHGLPSPFHVLATQNPLEQDGTYPLPEAQLDRFLLQINVDYPEHNAERQMLLETTGVRNHTLSAVMKDKNLKDAQTLIRKMPVSEKVLDAILTLVRRGRPDETDLDTVKTYVTWAPGPRASQSLMLACRAKALLDGRYAPSVDDVIALAKPVLQHRMALNLSARAEGITLNDIITEMCKDL